MALKEDLIGNYLINDMGAFHGGIHSGGVIKSIANGNIVAYKIASKYIEEVKSTDKGDVVTNYSDCFILIKHKYSYIIKENDQDSNKEFIYYSLYAHLSIKDELLNTEPTPPFLHWSTKISSKETLKTQIDNISGINLREKPNGKCLGIIPYGCDVVVYPKSDKVHWYSVTVPKLLKQSENGDLITVEIVGNKANGYYFNRDITNDYVIESVKRPYPFFKYADKENQLPYFKYTDKENMVPCFIHKLGPCKTGPMDFIIKKNLSKEDRLKSIVVGAVLFENNNTNSKQKGIIRSGTTVMILEKSCSEWFKIRTNEIYLLVEDTKLKAVYKKVNKLTTGWCRNVNGQFDRYVELEYDKIVELEKPIPVLAGDLLGYASKYEANSASTRKYVAAHVEVFSNDDVPAFLEDMKKLITDKNKTLELKEVKTDFKTESFTHITMKKIVNASQNKKSEPKGDRSEPKGDRIKPEKLSLSEDGKLFIKAWEIEKLNGYWDSKGYLTVGIGTLLYDKKTNKKIERKDNNQVVNCKEVTDRVAAEYIKTDSEGNKSVRITKEKSIADFNKHVKNMETAVRKLNVDFYQWEFDAMVCLFFNTGAAVEAPSLRKHLKNGNYTDAGKQFNDITNKDTEGLVNRRAAEMDMFLNGNESYISFKNNNNTERDKLVDKLNAIRKELGVKKFIKKKK